MTKGMLYYWHKALCEIPATEVPLGIAERDLTAKRKRLAHALAGEEIDTGGRSVAAWIEFG